MKVNASVLTEESSAKAAKNGKREFICEQQGKNIYSSDKPDLIIQEFKANGTEDGKKRSKSKDTRSFRNEISSYLFEYIEGFHIPTYFVNKLSETEMMVRKTEAIPLTVQIFNSKNDVLSRRFQSMNGSELEFPVIEHYVRQNGSGETWVNEYHIYAFGIATPEEYKQMNRIASKANAVLRGLCDRRQLFLSGMRLEFGRYKDQILLCDELSPYTCHFIDRAATDKHHQDRFVPSADTPEASFAELCDRLKLKL